MKRLIFLALVVNAALLAGRVWQELPAGAQGAATPALDERFCGDANGDGKIDVSDAINIVNFLFTGLGESPYCIAQGLSLDELYVNEGQPGSVTSEMIVDGSISETDLGFSVAAAGHTHAEFVELVTAMGRVDVLEGQVAALEQSSSDVQQQLDGLGSEIDAAAEDFAVWGADFAARVEVECRDEQNLPKFGPGFFSFQDRLRL